MNVISGKLYQVARCRTLSHGFLPCSLPSLDHEFFEPPDRRDATRKLSRLPDIRDAHLLQPPNSSLGRCTRIKLNLHELIRVRRTGYTARQVVVYNMLIRQ
jgi:hypothetical protein